MNGRTLYVETSGEEGRPVVVLLHHGLGSVRAWREQIPALAGIGCRVIAYDRWGYGQSDFRQGLGIPGFADDLADLEALLSTFNPSTSARVRRSGQAVERSTLVGHSDGGTIALLYAAQRPEAVSALVTIAAHVYVEPKMEVGIEAVKASFENDARFRASLRRVHGEKYETVFHNWYDGWRRPENLGWDMRSRLQTISCPTLVIQGAGDEHATPQHAADIVAALPNARLWLVPGAGHMLVQEQADIFNARMVDFLQSVIAERDVIRKT